MAEIDLLYALIAFGDAKIVARCRLNQICLNRELFIAFKQRKREYQRARKMVLQKARNIIASAMLANLAPSHTYQTAKIKYSSTENIPIIWDCDAKNMGSIEIRPVVKEFDIIHTVRIYTCRPLFCKIRVHAQMPLLGQKNDTDVYLCPAHFKYSTGADRDKGLYYADRSIKFAQQFLVYLRPINIRIIWMHPDSSLVGEKSILGYDILCYRVSVGEQLDRCRKIVRREFPMFRVRLSMLYYYVYPEIMSKDDWLTLFCRVRDKLKKSAHKNRSDFAIQI